MDPVPVAVEQERKHAGGTTPGARSWTQEPNGYEGLCYTQVAGGHLTIGCDRARRFQLGKQGYPAGRYSFPPIPKRCPMGDWTTTPSGCKRAVESKQNDHCRS